MKTAIIVLNYNDSKNTINFVNNILKYNVIDKIVVVDNLSTKENEFEELKSLECEKVDIIRTDKNGGYAYGNNCGLRYIDEKYDDIEYVIISNPDVGIKEEDIITTIKHLEKEENVAICSPRMHFASGPARRAAWKERKFLIDVANSTRLTELILFSVFKGGEYSKKDYEKDILDVDNVAGSFFIAKRNIFKEIGYFDENTFLFYEEDILGKKIRNAGYKLHLLNNIHFMHYDSQTIGKLMNMFKKMDILFDSKIYYHKTYNNARNIKLFVLKILRYIRKFELIFELPILKVFKK